MGFFQHNFRTVQCKTIDGIGLEGWFYEAEGIAPGIIITHGFNCPKEIWVGEKAQVFHSKGYNVLVYDSRGIGASGGEPRSQIDPWRMVEDISDLICWMRTQPSVDSSRIILWGVSLGATVSAVAAAVDRRVAALLMMCPIFSMVRADRRAPAFAQLQRDRQSQLKGNEPFMVAPFNKKGENLIGYAGSGGPGGMESHLLWQQGAEFGPPTFSDRITLQSFYKMALFRPRDIIEEMLEGIPTMMMIPEHDNISPAEEQKAVFDKLKTPKKLYWGAGEGHMTIVKADRTEVWKATFDFIDAALEGKIIG